jgi:hypothetical protein
MPVNAILGPGRWNVDMGLSRAFRLVDQQVQFRMETFDVFNTMPTNNPVSALSSSVSGRVTSLAAGTAPRIHAVCNEVSLLRAAPRADDAQVNFATAQLHARRRGR